MVEDIVTAMVLDFALIVVFFILLIIVGASFMELVNINQLNSSIEKGGENDG